MSISSDPYVPQPVPDTGNPDLERYIAEELARLHLYIGTGGVVAPAYGGIVITIPQTATVGTTPVQITGYDTVRPLSGPVSVELDAPGGMITSLSAGVYFGQAVITAAVEKGVRYTAEIYADGLPTGIVAIDVSASVTVGNSDPTVHLVLAGQGAFPRGTEISVYVYAGADGQKFDIIHSELMVHRVSEELR